MFEKIKNDSLLSKMISIVIPIALQNLMLSLVSATDAFMLGFLDQSSLSAVSLAGQIQFVLNLLISGVSAGCGLMIAQYIGKNDKITCNKIISIALTINLIIGLIFSSLGLLIPNLLLRIFTNDSNLIALGATYLKSVFISYLLVSISQIFIVVLKNTGNVRSCSIITTSAVIINLILNGILIFGLFGAPRLGVKGAAYATVACRLVELIWSFIDVKRFNRLKVSLLKIFEANKDLFKDFVKYASPVMLAALVWGLGFTSYSVILGHMGDDVVGANSIASTTKAIIQSLVRGVSAGAGIIIGNMLGANKVEEARISGKRITKISIIIGIVTGLFLVIISPIVVHFAPLTETAKEYLQIMFIILGFNVFGQAINTTVLDGIFCAGGDAIFDVKGNLFAMYFFSIPLGFLLAFVFNAPVWLVYIVISMDEVIKLPAVYLHYKKHIWLKNITRDNEMSA